LVFNFPITSFEVRADDRNEFLRALALSGCGFGGEDVVANMSFRDPFMSPFMAPRVDASS
jgi:hypothetical protein